MANAFFVRCDCRNRRFTGGKSRFLQEANGGKGIANAADELCGIAYRNRSSARWSATSSYCWFAFEMEIAPPIIATINNTADMNLIMRAIAIPYISSQYYHLEALMLFPSHPITFPSSKSTSIVRSIVPPLAQPLNSEFLHMSVSIPFRALWPVGFPNRSSTCCLESPIFNCAYPSIILPA